MKPAIRTPLLLALLLGPLLGGCDPYERKGTWSLPPDNLGANDTNLRAMLVNPSDLTQPHGDEGTSIGALTTRPVIQLYKGERAPLPNGNTTAISSGSSGSNGQQGGLPGSGAGGSLGAGMKY